MSITDWIVLLCTLLLIVAYGIYKSRGIKNIDGYLLGNKELPWYKVGLSVMATQASAITFLSAPGLAYTSGMSFVQFYFGLPLAMIVLCITFVPIFDRMKVFTAYEFLEQRFDIKTRGLTAILFLIQRGISTGITIFAPSIILSSILQIDVTYTTLFIGGLVVVYTTYGGSKAVSNTQMLQMSIIFLALFAAGIMVIKLLPSHIGMIDALHIAGKAGKTNAIDFTFDLNNQYTVWTGLIGGFFLQLSYFGTDQSQVGRYISGSSVKASRIGLLMNGLLKIPMQFCILLIGVFVFVYYQFQPAPLFFNDVELKKVEQSEYRPQLMDIEQHQAFIFEQKKEKTLALSTAIKEDNTEKISGIHTEIQQLQSQTDSLRQEVLGLIKQTNAQADLNDNNYIFLSFVKATFPIGFIGLLVAVIFLASMGATSSAINSLATTSMIDIYKRFVNPHGSISSELRASRILTFSWGVFTVIIALYASKLGNLLEAVNILGSLFYGTILGIFLVAFYLKKVKGTAVFYAAVCSELIVFLIFKLDIVAFLWLNLIGCILVILLAIALQRIITIRHKVS